jgi:hypothetical protein
MSYGDITGPGRELHARFVALGEMTGKTADEIICAVGQPTSRSSMAFGQMLLQWQAPGCHMALLFDANGQFIKITHEYAKYAAAPSGCLGIFLMFASVPIVAVALWFFFSN